MQIAREQNVAILDQSTLRNFLQMFLLYKGKHNNLLKCNLLNRHREFAARTFWMDEEYRAIEVQKVV